MAPDGNIYLPRTTNLGAILYPDSLAPKCRYVDSVIALAPGTTAFFGLPTFYNDYVSKNRIQAENCCESDTVFIYADKDTISHDSAHWFVNGRRIPGRYFSCATVINDTGYASIMLVVYNPSYTDTLYKDVYIRPSPPALYHSAISLCPGDSASLQAWSPGISGYTWNTGSRDSSITVNQAGLYTVIRSKGGCSRQENIPVSVKPVLTIGLPHDTLFCQYSTLVLSVAEPGATYVWSTGDTTATLQVTNPGQYSIHISKNGCGKTESIVVNQASVPVTRLGRDTAICRQTPLKLRAYHPYSTYTWSGKQGDSTLVVNHSGTYSVTVSNLCGSASDTITVAVKDCRCDLFVPNAFTPNADGANDRFIPVSNCAMDEYRLSIFDRWGRMLFESTDPYSGWNGQTGDAYCTSDTYIWKLMYSVSPPLGTGLMQQQNGTVTLLR
jgi:gliding motility-associated-like protein